MFYVSVINGNDYRLLAGPYATKEEAENTMPKAREIACKVDERAWFYAFGTCKAETNQPGILNQANLL